MDFKQLHCDGCGKQFEDGDDIVTCPVCGTPQHRSCYEALGGCVNAAKHELGFEWKTPDMPKEEPKPEENKANQPRFAPDFDPVRQSLNDGELPDVDAVIEQRVNAICPGITKEQRAEQLCDSEIGLTASFVGNGASRYMNKFRKMERNHSHTFNWGAFFFTPYWHFWRKQYKQGIIYLTINLICTILIDYVITPVQDIIMNIYQGGTATDAEYSQVMKVLPIVAVCELVLFGVSLFNGLFADKFYHKYVTKSLHEFKFIKGTEDNETALKYYLKKSSTSVVATLIACAVSYLLPYLISFLQTYMGS